MKDRRVWNGGGPWPVKDLLWAGDDEDWDEDDDWDDDDDDEWDEDEDEEEWEEGDEEEWEELLDRFGRGEGSSRRGPPRPSWD